MKLFEVAPQVVARRHGGRHDELLVTHRMLEGDAPRVERDAAVGIRAAGAVLQVAANRAADFGKLRPNLVVAARQQLDFDERIMGPPAEGPVAQERLLALGLRGVVGPRAVVAGVAHDVVVQLPSSGEGVCSVSAQ